MAAHANLPLFFQEKHTFIQQLKNHESKDNYQEYGNNQREQQHSVQSSVDALLEDYLDFYSIDFVKQDLAASHSIWKSEMKGFCIVEQKWKARKSNGHTLVVSHGYFDHTGIYGNVIRWALSKGFNVHCYDAPGHGLSNGAVASIDSFDEYSAVLAQILCRENYTNYTLLGQSTGSAVIANYLLDTAFFKQSKKPQQVYLLAPLVRSHLWSSSRWVFFAAQPFLSRIKRSFHSSSHNQTFSDFVASQDPLQAQHIPLNWLGAMEEWSQKIKLMSPNEQISPIIIQGTGDLTVDWRYNIPQIQQAFPQAKAFFIEDAAHQLVNESNTYWSKAVQLLNASP